MTAKKIKKIRKMIGKIQTFTIRETFSLFGDFFGHHHGFKMHDTKITAGTPVRAINIYMRNYRRIEKKINEHEDKEYDETTESWGKIMVTDEKGFMRFYR